MKRDIVTDPEPLHRSACPVVFDKAVSAKPPDLLQDLWDSLGESDLGLAAPQIGVPSRAFVCRLHDGRFAFINPYFEKRSTDRIPSIEGCLSIPGVTRCVDRSAQVVINAEQIYKDDNLVSGPIRAEIEDACILQHENDHLDGVLLTDLPITLTREERVVKRDQERQQKLHKQRYARKHAKTKSPAPPAEKKPQNKFEFKKLKKKARKQRQKLIRRLEAQERFHATQEQLFETTPVANTNEGDTSGPENTSLA